MMHDGVEGSQWMSGRPRRTSRERQKVLGRQGRGRGGRNARGAPSSLAASGAQRSNAITDYATP